MRRSTRWTGTVWHPDVFWKSNFRPLWECFNVFLGGWHHVATAFWACASDLYFGFNWKPSWNWQAWNLLANWRLIKNVKNIETSSPTDLWVFWFRRKKCVPRRARFRLPIWKDDLWPCLNLGGWQWWAQMSFCLILSVASSRLWFTILANSYDMFF